MFLRIPSPTRRDHFAWQIRVRHDRHLFVINPDSSMDKNQG
jgi:hypothetical protein